MLLVIRSAIDTASITKLRFRYDASFYPAKSNDDLSPCPGLVCDLGHLSLEQLIICGPGRRGNARRAWPPWGCRRHPPRLERTEHSCSGSISYSSKVQKERPQEQTFSVYPTPFPIHRSFDPFTSSSWLSKVSR